MVRLDHGRSRTRHFWLRAGGNSRPPGLPASPFLVLERNFGTIERISGLTPLRLWYCVFHDEASARGFERYLKSGSGRAFSRRHLYADEEVQAREAGRGNFQLRIELGLCAQRFLSGVANYWRAKNRWLARASPSHSFHRPPVRPASAASPMAS